LNLIRFRFNYTDEYILSKSSDWISDTVKYILKEDAETKMWEMQKISIGRQPQTEEDASSLSSYIGDIYLTLEDQIRYAEGKELKSNMRDGELVFVG